MGEAGVGGDAGGRGNRIVRVIGEHEAQPFKEEYRRYLTLLRSVIYTPIRHLSALTCRGSYLVARSYRNSPTALAPSPSIGIEVEALLAQLREEQVSVADADEVRKYIAQHSDMLPLVLRASLVARAQFGDTASYSLELYRDPDYDDEHLILYIRQYVYDDDFKSKLERVWAEYGPELEGATGWLLVTTDYRRPRD